MTSPLAGSLARTIGKALAPTFLPATLTRGGTPYPCRAIWEQWGKSSGPGGALTNPDAKALVLASTLAVEPDAGDILAVQGSSITVVSNKDSVNAVSTDPARAAWSLIGKFVGANGQPAAPYDAYAEAAVALGQPYAVYRSTGSNPLSTASVENTPVIVTSGKASGFSFTKSSTFEDVLATLQADFTNMRVGDYLVGPGGTFYVADMPALRPVVAVQCNATVTLTRPGLEVSGAGGAAPGLPSQPQSGGTYWGASTEIITDPNGAGEQAIRSGIPASMAGTTGRATGTGELPSDAAGPSRWRIYLPRSAFPHGSVQDRDIVIDDLGYRHQVSAAYWSTIGYRLEAVRLEN